MYRVAFTIAHVNMECTHVHVMLENTGIVVMLLKCAKQRTIKCCHETQLGVMICATLKPTTHKWNQHNKQHLFTLRRLLPLILSLIPSFISSTSKICLCIVPPLSGDCVCVWHTSKSESLKP